MDPLSDVLSLLKPSSYMSGGFDIGPELSIQFPKYEGFKCYAVVSGQCWLSVEGVLEPVCLTRGHCFLLPRGWPFRLATDLTLPPIDARTIFSTARRNGNIVSFNGGGEYFIVGGHSVRGSPADCAYSEGVGQGGHTLRDDTSSQGIDDAEKEANLFAAEILMPEEFLRKDLAGRSTLDLYDENYLPQLAQTYGVSVQAFMFRLQYLRYIEN